MSEENKKNLIVLKRESIFSKIRNFIKSFFTKEISKESYNYQGTSKDDENASVKPEKQIEKTLTEKLLAVDRIENIDRKEKLKRKIRILEAAEKKRQKQIRESIVLKKCLETEYYKEVYNKVNSGEIRIEELSRDEFSNILKMQKIEYGLITNKLKNTMDNL